MKLTAKVLFELTEDGEAAVELKGSNMVIKAGLLIIIKRLADLEERNILHLLSELTNVARIYETHNEMLPELRVIFDKMFGGKQ